MSSTGDIEDLYKHKPAPFKILSDAQFVSELERCENCALKPCKTACPVSMSPMDFIIQAKSLKSYDIQRAAAEMVTHNPFSGTCGVVCPDSFCMAKCVRKDIDRPVDIPSVQATIMQKAREMGVLEKLWTEDPPQRKHSSVAVIGGGPAGVGAATYLVRKGYHVTIYDKNSQLGGLINTIPPTRLPREFSNTDIDLFKHASRHNLSLQLNTAVVHKPTQAELSKSHKVMGMEELLSKHDAICVSTGLDCRRHLVVPHEEKAIEAIDFLWHPETYELGSHVAIIGAGAVAVDCAIIARRCRGVKDITIFYRRGLADMPLTAKERQHLLELDVDIESHCLPIDIKVNTDGKITGIRTTRVSLPRRATGSVETKIIAGTEQDWPQITSVIYAIGNEKDKRFLEVQHPKVFYAGDFVHGSSTVVEAIAYGKNAALKIEHYLQKLHNEIPADTPAPVVRNNVKSEVIYPGYNKIPVSIEADFFGRKIADPYIISSCPLSDSYELIKRCYDAGWAGAISKTAYDEEHIHIPNQYMNLFSKGTYGNCDNVSRHNLHKWLEWILRLQREYPDRLTIISAGGCVTGNDEVDKESWQRITRLLDKAGVYAIEFVYSCPQGGDGSHGDILSQNLELVKKLTNWVMEVADPNIPKLFKVTAMVSSMFGLVQEMQKIFQKYPNHKVGVTINNTIPSLAWKDLPGNTKNWKEGVITGMSGKGALPISFYSVAKAAPLGVEISGNCGIWNAEDAAHFIALGCSTVQLCSLPEALGLDIIDDLRSSLSHLLASKGLKNLKELQGIALPNPIRKHPDIPEEMDVSRLVKSKCIQCGNCMRCPYDAITMDIEDGFPRIDPAKCVGCSICVLQCPTQALFMDGRKPGEDNADVKAERRARQRHAEIAIESD